MATLDLHASALRALRDAMVERGSRESIAPPARRSISNTELGTADLSAILARVSPTCEALYLLMAADHQIDRREYMALRGAIRALTDGALGTKALDELLAVFAARLANEGRDKRLSRVAGQLLADRADAEATFMLAAAVALSDENADLYEDTMLQELGDLLGISHKRRRQLLAPAEV